MIIAKGLRKINALQLNASVFRAVISAVFVIGRTRCKQMERVNQSIQYMTTDQGEKIIL